MEQAGAPRDKCEMKGPQRPRGVGLSGLQVREEPPCRRHTELDSAGQRDQEAGDQDDRPVVE